MDENEKWEAIPEGEPNFYFVKNGKTWLCRIQFNGELSEQEQKKILDDITRND